jgi:REP element-mobilizing transposase RayT
MIFKKKGAAEAFERTLAEAAEKYAWRVHAYVVMGNHFHLAVELVEPNLSEGMKWLQGTWIRRFNKFRSWTGRPFQGRYKGLIVEPGHAFGQVCHYIHLNPVRAGIVEAKLADSYRWSSLHWFAKKDRPGWLDPVTVLAQSGGLRDTALGWRKHLSYLQFLGTDEEQKNELVSTKLSRGWCLGTKEFLKDMKDEALKRGASLDRERFEGLGKDEIKGARQVYWEDVLNQAAQLASIDLNQLPAPKMAPEKSILAAILKQSTSAPNGWLAEKLEIGQPATASQCARRWLLNKDQKRKVERIVKQLRSKKLLSRVKT